jgi:hypothetical protein
VKRFAKAAVALKRAFFAGTIDETPAAFQAQLLRGTNLSAGHLKNTRRAYDWPKKHGEAPWFRDHALAP